ncbi:fluoride efflux transporter FluC [Tetragenococcus halophilus]|uniref:fluoride efflux transporter FluC n=1 Tax=Tetragenococcus halophilus TaxID=51669 RepID=UPI002562A3CE|nr:CrcB family protein [Tetragenococcus halophilus]GMG67166.1 fluoride efflux transporter CrcB [Tetragenococcus halophilus]
MYYVLLVIFGALGATSRYILSFIIDAGQFPGATLIINLLGCFLLAFVTRFLSQLPYLSAKLVSAIGTGFVGSFTTFSTFSLESAELFQNGEYGYAGGYILASLFGGLLACIIGYQVSHWLIIRRKGRGKIVR